MTTLDEVLQKFNVIIDDNLEEGSSLGFFPILYREVTKEIQTKLHDHHFENPRRVRAFTIRFAKKYFEAYETEYEYNWHCWKLALQNNSHLTVLQHLLLGMNAHINFDLARTTAEMFKYEKIFEFQQDFNLVNKVLAQKTNELQKRLNKINKLLWIIDKLGKNRDEQFAIFSMKIARSNAWEHAVNLSKLNHHDREMQVHELDDKTAQFGQKLIKQVFGIKFIQKLFLFFENPSTFTKLNILLGK